MRGEERRRKKKERYNKQQLSPWKPKSQTPPTPTVYEPIQVNKEEKGEREKNNKKTKHEEQRRWGGTGGWYLMGGVLAHALVRRRVVVPIITSSCQYYQYQIKINLKIKNAKEQKNSIKEMIGYWKDNQNWECWSPPPLRRFLTLARNGSIRCSISVTPKHVISENYYYRYSLSLSALCSSLFLFLFFFSSFLLFFYIFILF